MLVDALTPWNARAIARMPAAHNVPAAREANVYDAIFIYSVVVDVDPSGDVGGGQPTIAIDIIQPTLRDSVGWVYDHILRIELKSIAE
ncbi:MAG: hypothetical protein QM783_09345 [Phycisphaerales bacterium]